MKPRIYVDHAATTPLAEAAKSAMLPWLGSGNASSLYEEGRQAKDQIDRAREVISQRLGVEFGEVLFTSGGTEAANLAIIGAALAHFTGARKRILFSAAEHHAVLGCQPTLERLGYQVELIPVDRFARIDLEALQDRLSDDVLLVSVMHANNEFGTINPIVEIAPMVHAVGGIFHVDAVQTYLVGDWKRPDLGADLLSISGHKVNGPKGVGALITTAGISTKPLIVGGGQERELRGGTENVAAISGFSAATQAPRTWSTAPRDAFEDAVRDLVTFTVDPSQAERLPGHSHFRIPGIRAESLLILLDRMGVAASSGAACSSGAVEPSHVMLAAGFSRVEAKEAVRFSFGHGATVDLAHEAALRLREAAVQIRGA